MKRNKVLVAVLSVLLLSSCGGSDSTSTEAGEADAGRPNATSSPGYNPPAAEALKGALVTAADVPKGYTLVAPDQEDEDEFTSECGKQLEALTAGAVKPFSEATVEFTNEDSFASLEHEWSAYGDEDEVETLLDTAEEFFGDCDSFTETLEGNKVTFRVEEADVTELGDRSLAYTVSGKVPSQLGELSFELALVAVQSGALVQTVTQGGLGEADLATATKVAQLGLDRVEAL